MAVATPAGTSTPRTASLLAELRAFCLPGGAAAARGVRGIRATQRGDIRSGPTARWNPFEAEEFVDATRAGFQWTARMGRGVLSVVVTDAYEEGHGRLMVSKGPIQLTKLVGPDVDKGELQRYFGYVAYCPPMLLNNPFLEFSAIAPRTLHVRDRQDLTGTSAEIDIGADGCPALIRAVRPMTVGTRVRLTPWSASGSDPRERDGLRVWDRMEASWHPPDGAFTYVRIELTSFALVR